MTDDAQLLRKFAVNGDEQAFRDLVARNFDLVYSTALRQLNGDSHLAQDVAQTVFTDLARKARRLTKQVFLAGWLYEAARFAAAKVVRGEQRRRMREQEALAMQDLKPDSPPEWERLAPVLDGAMGALSSKDRNAVLLHYFEAKDFRAVGVALGVSDDAAQKRVSRALAKLRAILVGKGVNMSEASLTILLKAGAVHSAPHGLAQSVANVSLAGAEAIGAAGASTVLLQTLGPLKALFVAASLLALLVVGLGALRRHEENVVLDRRFMSVSLSNYFSGNIATNWTPVYGKQNNLAALGQGRRVLEGIPFDVHGVVQLEGLNFKQQGFRYPDRVEGIPVAATARKIHLLHANSGFADAAGTTVATLVLHYADGQQAEFPLLQEVHFLDWWEWPGAKVKTPSDSETVVAWSGSNPAAELQGATIRLFATTFLNPEPEKEIQTIDYVSAMTNGAPFMVALTLER
jgi:RNA polymerase sigma factor (sigma-70 family)